MLKDVQVFILKIIESTFPKHTHTYLVPGNLVSGNMLYNILKFEAIVFIREHMSKKKTKKKTKEHMSIVPQQKELVFFC